MSRVGGSERFAAASLAAALLVHLSVAAAAGLCGDGLAEPPEEACDDGNTFGGDGCAANCTREHVRIFDLDPGRSFALTQLKAFAVPFRVEGRLLVTTGEPSASGFIPAVIRRDGVTILGIAVPGLVCACPVMTDTDEFGPDNIASGIIDCGNGQAPIPPLEFEIPGEVTISQDHDAGDTDPECVMGQVEREDNLHPGICNGPVTVSVGSRGPRGSAVLITGIDIQLLFDGGTCSVNPNDPAKGPDGVPCTDDDPVGPLSTRFELPAVFTGRATTTLYDANGAGGSVIGPGESCGALPCRGEIEGRPFDCDRILSVEHGGLETGEVALTFPLLDVFSGNTIIGDSVVTVRLVPRATCPGDCSGDDLVGVDELVMGVNIAIGAVELQDCFPFDTNGDRAVSIDELISAVSRAIDGCSANAG